MSHWGWSQRVSSKQPHHSLLPASTSLAQEHDFPVLLPTTPVVRSWQLAVWNLLLQHHSTFSKGSGESIPQHFILPSKNVVDAPHTHTHTHTHTHPKQEWSGSCGRASQQSTTYLCEEHKPWGWVFFCVACAQFYYYVRATTSAEIGSELFQYLSPALQPLWASQVAQR